MKQKIKTRLIQLLKCSFGVGIFAYFVASGRIDLAKVQQGLFHSPWALVALTMGCVTLITTTIRWRLLIQTQGIEIGFLRAFKLVFIGHFFNIVIPGTISGDVVKVYYITRREDKKIAAGFSVLMDRFIGLVVLVMVTFVTIWLNYDRIAHIPELMIVAKGVSVAFLGLMVAFLFFLWKKEFSLPERWPMFLRHLVDAFWAYRKNLDKLFLAGVFTFLNYGVNVLFFYSAARAVGENIVPFFQYLFLVPIGFFIMAIPISPAGLGVGQGVYLKLFEWLYGYPTTVGADIVTLYQIIVVCWALVGMLVYVSSRHEGAKKPEVYATP